MSGVSVIKNANDIKELDGTREVNVIKDVSVMLGVTGIAVAKNSASASPLSRVRKRCVFEAGILRPSAVHEICDQTSLAQATHEHPVHFFCLSR